MINKGLNYVPTYSNQKFDFITDLHKLIRKMKLKIFFSDKKTHTSVNRENVPAKLQKKSNFDPIINNVLLDSFKLCVTNEVLEKWETVKKPKPNLTHKQNLALKELKQNTSIVLKKADKGGATVVMSREQYIAEAESQLNDTNVYMKLDGDPTSYTKKEIDTILYEALMDGTISKEINDALQCEHPRVPLLYLVPKIHKSLEAPPGRPIVSGIGSVLEPLAVYVDSFLQKIVKNLPGCLKDTGDFLANIDHIDCTNVQWLCTLDIKSLYTNIPVNEGIEAVREKLNENSQLSNQTIAFLITLLEIILTKNYFRFGSDFFLQQQGTSMGSPVAPSLANIFMSKFELAYAIGGPHAHHINKWMRYVDDIFLLWQGTESELDAFIEFLNSRHQLIRFTVTKSQTTVQYLDVEITKENNALDTKLFTKKTDRNNMLERTSYHAPQTFGGIPKGQFIRAKRICKDQKNYEESKEKLIKKFSERGYNKKEIERIGKEVGETTREESRTITKKSKKEQTDSIMYISKFDNHAGLIRNTIKKWWGMLQADQKHGKLFKQFPKFVYGKGKTIGNHLIRADIIQPKKTKQMFLQTNKKGTYACLSCQHCSAITKGEFVVHPLRGNQIPLKGYYTCNTKNVIYALKCPCGKLYIGQTSRAIKLRLNEHKSNIKRYSQKTIKDNSDKKTIDTNKSYGESSVARHFFEARHGIAELRWQIIEEVYGDPTQIERNLLRREAYWITTLETLVPKGLNEECNLNVFI